MVNSEIQAIFSALGISAGLHGSKWEGGHLPFAAPAPIMLTIMLLKSSCFLYLLWSRIDVVHVGHDQYLGKACCFPC